MFFSEFRRFIGIIIPLLGFFQGWTVVVDGFSLPTWKNNVVAATSIGAPKNQLVFGSISPCHRHCTANHRERLSLSSTAREQVEQYLSESYPKFCTLLQQNPMALQQMRESDAGFSVFAVSDAAFYDSLRPGQLPLLEAACNEPELQEVVSTMAAYHMVSVPVSGDIMASFNVVATRVGELPVELAPDGSGALYVNGVRILQSYVFEDVIIQNYQDRNGNMIGSQSGEGGKRYIVHDVESLICPNELWELLHHHYHSALSE